MKWNSLIKTFLLTLCLTLPFNVLAGPMVNINTAPTDVLVEMLQGIGPAKAQAIVDFRETNGPFKTVDDLAKVKGIGSSTVTKNLQVIAVDDSQ